MDEIALHIEYLLHTNDCVIVPGLGGFVVNVSGVERNGLWGVDAPRCELIFNSKLTYNDGLLAESLMKTNSESFETANDKINAACLEIKKKLSKGEQIIWSNLGVFKGLNEASEKNRPLFTPNKNYIRPQFFGLTNVRFKPASLLPSKNINDRNAIPLKPFIQYITSGIAMAILLFFIVVSYSNFESNNQKAEMVSNSLIFKNNISNVASEKNSNNELTKPKAEKLLTNTDNSSSNSSLASSNSISKYYVVVGVYEVRDVAEKTLSRLKKEGFSEAAMLESPRRLDVYSSSFTDKREAWDFLKKFQAENPKYHDAWLLKR